jgi:hypothetical protein
VAYILLVEQFHSVMELYRFVVDTHKYFSSSSCQIVCYIDLSLELANSFGGVKGLVCNFR